MKTLLAVVVTFLLFQTVSAQITSESPTPLGCDGMLGYFDSVLSRALSEENKDSILIVIARSGNGEKLSVNQQRLKSFEKYFTGFRPFPKERLVLAKGEKRNGLGKLEFYINGKLADELFLNKKQRVCSGCC